MRTTIAIDDELFAKAREFCRVKENLHVVREALKAFVEREAARRLAGWEAIAPDAKAPRAAVLNDGSSLTRRFG